MKRATQHAGSAPTPRLSSSEVRGGLSAHSVSVVTALNAQLLDGLCEQAIQGDCAFPLPERQRARFARLTVPARERIARCSVLLVDAGFADVERWKAVIEPNSRPSPRPMSHWLTAVQGQALAHSTFLLAWHVCQTQVMAASVLLGMPREVAAIISKRPVRDLAYLARHHSDWIVPRWGDDAEIWDSLLDLSARVPYEDPVCLSTRGLQLSGRPAPMLPSGGD